VLTVRGKGRYHDLLPLPSDVGEALATYLRQDRPACTTRRVFIRSRAPHRGFAHPSSLSTIVCRAVQRAGLQPSHKGAHLLRHSLATGECSVAGRRWPRSARFSATAHRTPPRFTRKST
jgi:site-specific recombinase XerD